MYVSMNISMHACTVCMVCLVRIVCMVCMVCVVRTNIYIYIHIFIHIFTYVHIYISIYIHTHEISRATAMNRPFVQLHPSSEDPSSPHFKSLILYQNPTAQNGPKTLHYMVLESEEL